MIRGIRNNNPGNIDRTGVKWLGMADDQSSDRRFIVFKEMKWGCRAMIRTLMTYRTRHKLSTIRGIVSRWAPPNENNTNGYIARVAKDSGFGQDEVIPFTAEAYVRIAKAMACVECTYEAAKVISDATWQEAALLAGLE